MDIFLGYNQIKVNPEDHEKTTFTTLWGTIIYDKMTFGLMNEGETFQRVMDIGFVDENEKFVVVYIWMIS